MKNRHLIIGWCFLLTLSTAGCFHDSGITAKKIDALIAKEVPARADKSQVLAFSGSYHIEHSDVVEFPSGYLDEPESDTDLSSDKLKGKVSRVNKYAAAKIPNVKSGFLVSYDVIIKFYFDKDDRLVEYLVRSKGTGL